MNVRPLLLLSLAVVALLAPAASADAAARYPSIAKITPLNLAIGETMTVTGRNFVRGKNKNTVVFKRDKQRAIFAKAESATTTKLKVVVPEKLRPFLAKRSGAEVPTKFRVRILAKRFGKRYTAADASPIIAPLRAEAPAGPPAPPAPLAPPPDCDRDGLIDGVDEDDDNDGMTDLFEQSIRTNTCAADTDGDGMWDLWEYRSALDLNLLALPYPGKRPHPNPLDGGDAEMDYDGDGLWTHQEHRLWQAGGRPGDLNYSDGDQSTGATVDAPTGGNAHLDWDSDGELTDDEKDFDGDRLSNWVEANGPLQVVWWTLVKPFKEEKPYFNQYDALDLTDPDTDGDTRVDGEDDQDFDGWTNIEEMRRGPYFVQPFNPCLPNPGSRTCSRYIPADMEEPYPPFNGELDYDHDLDADTPQVALPWPLPWPHPDDLLG